MSKVEQRLNEMCYYNHDEITEAVNGILDIEYITEILMVMYLEFFKDETEDITVSCESCAEDIVNNWFEE